MNVKQQRNLIKVALFLARGKSPVKFDMAGYTTYLDKYRYTHHTTSPQLCPALYSECGTSCCFAGHGPLVLGNAYTYADWTTYCAEVFGVVTYNKTRPVWLFLFDAAHPNNTVSAARRALLVLKYPRDYNTRSHLISNEDVIKGLRKLQRSKLKDIVFE